MNKDIDMGSLRIAKEPISLCNSYLILLIHLPVFYLKFMIFSYFNQQKYIIYASIFLFSVNGLSQSSHVTIYGYVEDETSQESLINANIYDKKSKKGVTSNNYGFFSLTLPSSDTINLIVSYIGYKSRQLQFTLHSDSQITVQLEPVLFLEEIEIKESISNSRIERTPMSQIDLLTSEIKTIPAVLGEIDIMKALQLLPGVQAGSEGQIGLYVRGGSPDQNLILLDGVPVYNPGHALGFLSTFNADAIKNITLIKGGFPARYGGRLSSILEINMKEGNLKEFQGEGTISSVSSKFLLEIPLIKNKTSLLLAGRRTYLDILMRPLIKQFANTGNNSKVKPSIYFYDLNLKLQHKVNEKHRLFLSSYATKDIFYFEYQNDKNHYGGGINWDNYITGLRWNWQTGTKTFLNTSLTYSRYTNQIESKYEVTPRELENVNFLSRYQSGIEDFTIKTHLDFQPTIHHYIKAGGSIILHKYRPGAINLKSTINNIQEDTLVGNYFIKALEGNLFIEDEMILGKLQTNIGLHASFFKVRNKTYYSIQPRLGLSYLLKQNWSLKASLSTMQQYINLLGSSTLSLPTDLWVPSTDRILPQQAWQTSLGTNFKLTKQIELNLEIFYKKMNNVLSYQEGENFLTESDLELERDFDWESKVTQGKGIVYGIELLAQKKVGKTTGWVGYTLSKNLRQFNDVNLGRAFPYRYDRRHDLTLVIMHQFNKKISASGSWVFRTGNAISLPSYRFATEYEYYFDDFDNQLYEWFSPIHAIEAKNAFRMSNFHRLDLSITFYKKKKKYERKWIISTYNTYFHANPFTILPILERIDDSRTRIIYKEISIIPFIIPSIAYYFKF